MAEMKKFSTQREGTPVEIDGNIYQVVLLVGSDVAKYRKTMGGRVKYGTNGRPQGLTSYEGLEATLISYCLRDPHGAVVPVATIDAWPQPVIKNLFEMCLEMNKMKDMEEKDEKND